MLYRCILIVKLMDFGNEYYTNDGCLCSTGIVIG